MRELSKVKYFFAAVFLMTAGTWGLAWAADAFFVGSNGNIGIGTNDIEDTNALGGLDRFHLARDGIVLALFESSDNGPVQVRFKTNSTNRRFLATDANNVPRSQVIFGEKEVKFAGQNDSGELMATFNLTGLNVNGSISTINSGQVHPDYVFEDSYDLEPIEEHTKYMLENKHLKAVGPGTYDENGATTIDVGAKMLGMLEELEKAHLYINQLHGQIKEKDARLAAIDSRLSELESKID